MTRERAFGTGELVRLWFSYQRYAFLLAAMALGLVAAVIWWNPTAWYLWLLIAFPVFKLGVFTVEVYRRWPRKIRATHLAKRRIETGRFAPRFVENYCGDPCFRVVAREILVRAGIERAERKALIREYAKRAKERSSVVLMVNHKTGVEVRIGGSQPTG